MFEKIKKKYGYSYFVALILCLFGIILFLTSEQYKTEAIFLMLLPPAFIAGGVTKKKK